MEGMEEGRGAVRVKRYPLGKEGALFPAVWFNKYEREKEVMNYCVFSMIFFSRIKKLK